MSVSLKYVLSLLNVISLLTNCSSAPNLQDVIDIFQSALTYRRFKKEINGNQELRNGVYDLCYGLQNTKRIGCCNSVKYIDSVMVVNGTFVKFVDKYDTIVPITLPRILQQEYKRTWHLSIPVSSQQGLFPSIKCKSYFNGTLHVSGRKTIHKLFHACKRCFVS